MTEPYRCGARGGSPRTGRWLILLLFLSLPLAAEEEEAQPRQAVTIGYVELEGDSRYRSTAYTGIEFRSLGRPYPGAQLGIEDARMIGRVTGADFSLQKQRAESVKALTATVREWQDEGIHFVLADLPGPALLELSRATADLPLLLINVSAPDDALRQKDCQANLAHTYPSHSMLTDALVQFLVSQKWQDLLVLEGEQTSDRLFTDALVRSAKKFGAEIVDRRNFSLSKNPKERTRNNIALVTGEARYDVVFVADASGEFGRYLPYQTRLPRPVVGDAGLVPHAWHWSWHRHGAPQLQHRFEEANLPRRMNDASWAAWAAVKAISQAALRSGSAEFGPMRDFMLGEELNLDTSKGNPSSFRSWNQQLRQPLLLASADAVAARAPLQEFLHQTERLDTLGIDRPETRCQLQ